jgi:hypothetical protein
LILKTASIRTISFVSLALLVSCSVALYLYRPSPEPRSEWLNKWLETPACQLPCWENITPGKTTISEAKERLFQIANITNIHGSTINTLGTELSWNFENHGGSGSIQFEPEDNGVVSRIFLGHDQEPGLTVGEVIQKFGEPDFVQVYDCRGNQCMVSIINTDMGYYLETLLTKNFVQVNISPDTPVIFIWLIEPGRENFLKAIGGIQPYISEYTWVGYGYYMPP